ncbi:MAG: ABC transporter permease [Verrucomicrobiota bacterium]|nr:ABC transporter permease [Verrucomicrobiota bacterium]
MITDLKYALRMLVKSPAFTAVVVITLALGIGANTAIFSVVQGTLLRPLPFPKADRLVRIYEAEDDQGGRGSTLNLSEQTVRQWREHGREIFEDIGAATGANVTVGAIDGGPAQNVPAVRMSANFLSVLGLPPVRGRTFTADEDRPGGAPVIIISDNFWQQNLGGRADALGSLLPIDGVPHTIVGIMPKAFRHPYRANIWLPLAIATVPGGPNTGHYLYGVGRMRAGLTPVKAEEAARRVCAAINQATPDPNNARGFYLPPLRESFVMDLRPKILVIVGAALCALLIAAANFAGLLLARVVEREGEFALRAALGASRRRLVRQQLVQALILAALGTLCGLLIASWVTPALFAMSPEGSDATGSAMREFDYAARIDWPVFTFAAGAMLLVGLGFGLLPAARASRTDLRGAISSTARGATLDRSTRRLLGSFVVIELAVSAALLMASITATQYFGKMLDEPWGFETDRRVAFNATYSERLFDTPGAKQRSIDTTLAELRTLPGVETATVTVPSPMNAPRNLLSVNAEGAPAPEPRGYHLAYLRGAVPDYFKSVGQRLVQGRDFAATDTPDSPPVCIVSETFVKRFWPGQDPIGKRVKWGRLDGPRPWLTVVGVVSDIKAVVDPRDGEVVGMVVRPMAQLIPVAPQMGEMTFVIETKGEGLAMDSAIRAALARADSRLAAYEVISLEEAAAQSRVTERFIFVLVSLFGGLGLILAAIGLYGLLSLQVARRQREFGIRSALGATAKQLVRLVARQGASLLAIGFAAGAIATWGVIRIVQNQWAEMPAPNVIAWLSAAFVLAGAVVLACWLPARRAARVDPVIALRAE